MFGHAPKSRRQICTWHQKTQRTRRNSLASVREDARARSEGLAMSHTQSKLTRCFKLFIRISGLVAEYIVAIDVARVRFPADAFYLCPGT